MRPPCGTPAGQIAHKRNREPVCLDCCAAKADYIRANRILRGTSNNVLAPVEVLWLLLLHAPDETLAVARRVLGVRTVAALRRTAQPPCNRAVTP